MEIQRVPDEDGQSLAQPHVQHPQQGPPPDAPLQPAYEYVPPDQIAPNQNQFQPINSDPEYGILGNICIALSCFITTLLFFPIACICAVKTLQEYERGVVYRLGRLMEVLEPGLQCIIPCTDELHTVDMRSTVLDFPPQEILTKDTVTIAVDAIVYYSIVEPRLSIDRVVNLKSSLQYVSQTSLRNALSAHTLMEILGERDTISANVSQQLDLATDPWGVRVERLEIKDIRLTAQLQRAMAAEAEASRDARAKVIAAEGEQFASHKLVEAARMMNEQAMQLRLMQTLNTVGARNNKTVIVPIPIVDEERIELLKEHYS